MSSSLRRGALAAVAIAFPLASLAACGAGSNAQTLEVKPDNAETKVGDIKVQNALVITQPDIHATGPAVVAAAIFNNGASPQTVDSITLPNNQSAQLKPAKGKSKLVVPAHGSLVIGGKGNASAVLPNGREAVQDGSVRKVTFTLSSSGAVSLQAFVVPADNYFSKWGPSSIPTSTPTNTASKTPKPGKSATGTATPTGTPTGTATGTGSSANTPNSSATPTDATSASATPSGR
ncbi:DUF461 domain-containing protein [Streptomyces spinosirectus]|uniref:DUF461 domain-containing protein n=1 Tax=Streptomyces TaxID=1883 RepID=UPI000D34ACB4|nr:MULTISPECIES: DUF461 domain-containing protein [Streptomyces]MBY8339997.1 DUF461 domain-containing protein [Streptomyces plumbidurans]PTM98232.1 hypothetical protein C7821_103448 [Streptomyces sp. VMFN-G11Ma]UIR19620.1 DUF461 domain-containing protein [Streptomyces spinosirectus]